MGYLIDLRALEMRRLWDALVGAETATYEAAYRGEWPSLVVDEPDIAARRWSDAAGRVRSALAARRLTPIDDDGALFILAHARVIGRPLGTLIHTSLAGDLFRGSFLGETAAGWFGVPDLGDRLIARPLFGLTRTEYPCWGGLSAAEVAGLDLEREPDEPGEDDDEDMRGWLFDLIDALRECRAGEDVLALYH